MLARMQRQRIGLEKFGVDHELVRLEILPQ
jgi:hypothetical protein